MTEGFTHENGNSECDRVCNGNLVFDEGPARMPVGDSCSNPLELDGKSVLSRRRRATKKKSQKILGGAAANAAAWEFIAKVKVENFFLTQKFCDSS